jgi:GTPase SAR1 family protein
LVWVSFGTPSWKLQIGKLNKIIEKACNMEEVQHEPHTLPVEPFQSTVLDWYSNDIDTQHKVKTVLRSRVILVGDGCVGKSTLVRTLLDGGGAVDNDSTASDDATYNMTFGVELNVQSIPLPPEDGKGLTATTTVDLFLYSVGGSDIANQGKLCYDKCYEDINYIVYVYDATRRSSLHNGWIQRVRDRNIVYGHKIPCLVVANKLDLLDVSKRWTDFVAVHYRGIYKLKGDALCLPC